MILQVQKLPFRSFYRGNVSHLYAWQDHGADPPEGPTKTQRGEKKKKGEVIGGNQHGFTKGKSYLTNLVAFYNGVMMSVDNRRATDVIYLDLCKMIDTILHEILVTEFEKNRFYG